MQQILYGIEEDLLMILERLSQVIDVAARERSAVCVYEFDHNRKKSQSQACDFDAGHIALPTDIGHNTSVALQCHHVTPPA
ncbi:unnamed protein product [Zymoseptoria tritici ST99CH_3D7]|uniref:Uncharacterized protein n=1 Tax=Zymoseptoria tritici (strain ST99CH_3D7) TaxID=1276538 RepID=A0A1X7RT43_ZYMT9|nr:unnamed protein product [Zymoseptoria tritici ST99CH_3D7]